MKLRLESLTPKKLPVFRQLLGSDDFGGCFCAVWTSHSDDWIARCQDKAQPNFLITKKNVEEGRHVGFLAYLSEDLIGWTGSGPKTAFPFLKTKLGSRLSDFSAETWSIGCLAVGGSFRGQGLAERIVQGVIDEAREHRAVAIEAYPVRPFDEPRIFRGTYQLYKKMGFAEAGAEKDGEHEIVLMKFSLGVA